MKGELRVTVIATGFNYQRNQRQKVHRDGKESAFSGSLKEKRLEDIPLFEQMVSEPLEQTLGEILGYEEGFSLTSKDDPNIPAFLRRNME